MKQHLADFHDLLFPDGPTPEEKWTTERKAKGGLGVVVSILILIIISMWFR